MYSFVEIENIEKDLLFELAWRFKNSIPDFSTSMDRSLRYLDKIILPIIMASKEDKSYNPFSEIIEKYSIQILINKLKNEGFNLLPLGYSSDLTLESENYILNIDIKTANIDNPSDFKETIPMGINQITHVAKLRLNRKFLPSPYFVYPTIPPEYEIEGKKKLILTYGLLFIYPSYSDLLNKIRNEYLSLFETFNKKVKKALIPIVKKLFNISKEAEIIKIIESKPPKSRQRKDEAITESLIRGVFLHEVEASNILKSLEISKDDLEIIEEFNEKVSVFIENLRKRDIKPIGIVAISVPNGLLKEKYLCKFVSGKSYAKSIRYHYEDGIFEFIKEETGNAIPRVLFLDINFEYIDSLKRYFNKINLLDYKIRSL